MRNALLAFICLIGALGCGSLNFGNRNASNSANEAKPTASPETKPSPSANVAIANVSPAKVSVLTILKKSAGKYPYEIKLLENGELKGRLRKLLGKDFNAMEENWNVETPMEIENGVFMASACQAHNCGANSYLMFVDLAKDNINVFHIDENGTKTYFEKGKIELPKKFADELASDH